MVLAVILSFNKHDYIVYIVRKYLSSDVLWSEQKNRRTKPSSSGTLRSITNGVQGIPFERAKISLKSCKLYPGIRGSLAEWLVRCFREGTRRTRQKG